MKEGAVVLISCNCVLHFESVTRAATAIGITSDKLRQCLKSKDGFVREIEEVAVYVDWDL